MTLISRHAQSERVDALFAPWSQRGMPGAAVIVIQDGEVVHQKGYGLARLKKKVPIRPQTAFLLASVTKPFTALAVMILAERGKLDYRDPLAKFFGQFQDAAGAITIQQLLQHTSGLPDFENIFIEQGIIDKNWPRSGKSRPSRCEPTSKETLDLLAKWQKLESAPGTKYAYSNSGYVVLGQIVENVSKQRFARFVEAEIFRPAGMFDSVVYDERRPIVRNRAKSYSWTEGRYHNIDYTPLNFVYGEDGIYSTIEDMGRFSQTLYTEVLVKKATLDLAFTPGALDKYGFGWIVERDYVWHNGAWTGVNTYIRHDVCRNFSIVVLANCKELSADSMGSLIADIYLS
jgi:CubicO group peptidase (beta-lactamase class C family)